MPLRSIRPIAFALLAVAVTACTTPYKPGVPYYIEDVTVRAAPGVVSPGTAERIEADIEAVAARVPRQGAPKRLDVTITEFHTKNPAMALLVGDTNRMRGNATITGAGATEWNETVGVVSDAFLQGISGAIIAAARQREVIENELAERFSIAVSKAAYGGKLPRPGRAPAVRSPQPAPVVPAAPAEPAVANGAIAGV